jgi:peroxin-1
LTELRIKRGERRRGRGEAVGEKAAAMSSGGGMEVEVRVVGGARSCFVALPLHLIHALERTSASGDLPPVLALDLRTAAGGRWSLAWSGAASPSRAI